MGVHAEPQPELLFEAEKERPVLCRGTVRGSTVILPCESWIVGLSQSIRLYVRPRQDCSGIRHGAAHLFCFVEFLA